MKLDNTIEVAMNSGGPTLMMLLIIVILVCGILFTIATLHFFGPWFLLTVFGIVAVVRILYAVFNGK